MRGLAGAFVLSGMFLCAPGAMAQSIDAPLHVQTGDVYTVTVEQTQTSEIAGTNVEATLSHTYALTIVSADQRIWRYVPTSVSYTMPTGFPTPAAASDLNWPLINEGVSALIRASMDIGFECRVDEYGRCLEVLNWSMWRDRAENMVIMADAFARMMPPPAPDAGEGEEDASFQPTSAQKDEDSAGEDVGEGAGEDSAASSFNWERVREPVLRGVAILLDNFDGRDAAGTLAMIQYGPLMQGRPLTRRQPVAVSDEFEMPFNASPLRFTGTLQLERVNQRDNTATIVRRVTMDEASVRSTMNGMAQFVTSSVVQPIADSYGEGQSVAALSGMIEPMIEALSMRYEETTTATVDLGTGMARETRTDYTMTALATEGVETPVTVSGRTVIRIAPGAPSVQRLPRQ